MPMPASHYPPGWKEFSSFIRYQRAQGRCECTGECGLHRTGPIVRRCIERHHTPATFAKGTIRLTVAHLCNCQPICLNPMHVIAACQRCHLRIDRYRHAAHRLARKLADKQDTTDFQTANAPW
jgi:hypothetical protein